MPFSYFLLVSSGDIGTARCGNSVVRAGRPIETVHELFEAAHGLMFVSALR